MEVRGRVAQQPGTTAHLTPLPRRPYPSPPQGLRPFDPRGRLSAAGSVGLLAQFPAPPKGARGTARTGSGAEPRVLDLGEYRRGDGPVEAGRPLRVAPAARAVTWSVLQHHLRTGRRAHARNGVAVTPYVLHDLGLGGRVPPPVPVAPQHPGAASAFGTPVATPGSGVAVGSVTVRGAAGGRGPGHRAEAVGAVRPGLALVGVEFVHVGRAARAQQSPRTHGPNLSRPPGDPQNRGYRQVE